MRSLIADGRSRCNTQSCPLWQVLASRPSLSAEIGRRMCYKSMLIVSRRFAGRKTRRETRQCLLTSSKSTAWLVACGSDAVKEIHCSTDLQRVLLAMCLTGDVNRGRQMRRLMGGRPERADTCLGRFGRFGNMEFEGGNVESSRLTRSDSTCPSSQGHGTMQKARMAVILPARGHCLRACTSCLILRHWDLQAHTRGGIVRLKETQRWSEDWTGARETRVCILDSANLKPLYKQSCGEGSPHFRPAAAWTLPR
ncbi:hypothetical protein BJ912DRAFT_234518 [Pholiota molesta]|nr:hypothetical protein BJ912DRAFT_234518 [Pholiota molesta]